MLVKGVLIDNQIICIMRELQGRIQDFKLGGAHLQKLRRAERFYAKKSYFFQF